VTAAVAGAFNRLFSNEARVAALQTAYLHAIERAQGAAAARNNNWVTRQDRAAAHDATQIAAAYAAEAKLRLKASAAVKRTSLGNIRITARQIAQERRALARGLPSSLTRHLRKMGFSSQAISGFAAELPSAHVSPTKFSSLVANPVEQEANTAASGAYRNAAARTKCIARA
jgi:hypothetical protein